MKRSRNKTQSISRSQALGFTLLEVMVVVVILAVMAAAVIPNIIGSMEKAKTDRAKVDITSVQGSLETYKMENYQYPSTEQGIEALVNKPSGEPEAKNWRNYNKKLPMDPWGNPYHYLNPGIKGDIDIYSAGPDGVAGNEDDIGNWDLDN
ncbi:MAG: type II secretion system protein GspG [Thiotrichales bacterium]|nr:MAG: type II secretion system protein GspG [Thiotrichales bacterium]